MKRPGLFIFLFIGLLTALPSAYAEKPTTNQMSTQERGAKAQALYEEKCRTVAGENIYKTVPDVEGILLLKVRPERYEGNLTDPMWPGAAFALEFRGDSYISYFFGAELPRQDEKGETIPISKEKRGSIVLLHPKESRLIDHPGYRYVDVVIDESTGKRERVTGRWYEPWQEDKSYLKGYIKFTLDKKPTTEPPPRYAVTYEDHVVPEERALWVASSTIKVIDTQTSEVLGELTRYALGAPPSPGNSRPWLRARRCPDYAVDTNTATRKFVDQVLLPKREN